MNDKNVVEKNLENFPLKESAILTIILFLLGLLVRIIV
jgi:hypothetical protein